MLTKVLETKYENNFHQFNVGDPVVITITGVYVGYNHFQNKCIIKPDLHQLYNKTEIIDQLVEMDLKFVKHAPKTDPKQALIIPSLTDNVSLNEETNVDEIKNDETSSSDNVPKLSKNSINKEWNNIIDTNDATSMQIDSSKTCDSWTLSDCDSCKR
eukprot:448801_1